MVREDEGVKVHRTLPKVEKGTRDSEEWVKKVEPGEPNIQIVSEGSVISANC